MLKLLTVWITTNYGKFFKRREYQTILPVFLRNLYAGQEVTARTGESQQTMESFSREGNTRPSYLPSWEICMQVKKQQLEPDMEQPTVSKSGKEYIKAEYCHSACLTYMQNTSSKMPGWMKHKLE